jgi:hypothetical protein
LTGKNILSVPAFVLDAADMKQDACDDAQQSDEQRPIAVVELL